MGLGSFLSSPIATVIAGGMDRLTDNYWNNVLPRDEKAKESFKALVAQKKKSYNASLATGNARRSKLLSQAGILKNVEGFENQPIENLMQTIQMIEDAGLAGDKGAIDYLINNKSDYTIKDTTELDATKKKTPTETTDESQQTSKLMTGGGTTSATTPEAEDRSVFQILLHGQGQRAIEDSALSEMGMTRKEFEALSSPPVMKKLNIGQSAIKLAIKNKTSPLVEALILDRSKSVISTASTLGHTTETNIKNNDNKNMTVGAVSQEFLEILEEDPNSERAIQIETTLNGMLLDRKGIGTLAKNLEPLFEATNKFINDPKQNTLAQAEARKHYTQLNTLIAQAGNPKVSSDDLISLREKIQLIKSELKLIIGREIDVLSPEIKIALDGLKQKIETFSPGQYIDGKTGIQHLVDLQTEYANLQKNVRKLDTKDIREKENNLLTKIYKIIGVQPIKIPETMQETHDIIVKKLSELSGEIDVPSADDPEVIVKKSLKDYAVENYFPLYEAYKTGKQVDDSAIRFAQAAILSSGLEKEEDDDGLEILSTFNTSVKSSESTLNQVRSKFDKLNGTQQEMVQTVFDEIVDKDNKLKLLTNQKDVDGNAVYTPEKIKEEILKHSAERADLANLAFKASNFSDAQYDANVKTLSEEIKAARKKLQENSSDFTSDEHAKAIDLITNFETLANLPMLENKQREENLKKLNAIAVQLVKVGRKAGLPPPTTLEEKVNAIIEAEKLKNPNMTKKQESDARTIYAGMLAQGNIRTTKNGNFLVDMDFDTGKPVLVQVPSLTALGNKITMNLDQLEENKKQIKASTDSVLTTGKILKTFINHPNAFNITGTLQLFGADVSDLLNSMGGKTQPLFGKSPDGIQAIQQARAEGIRLLGTAKNAIFKDPRLSDQDLKIVRQYVAVLENTSLLGTTRGQAALMVIQAAMLKDAMLRKNDADFDNTTPISESYTPLTDTEYAGLKVEDKLIYNIEKQLGFKIGKNDKPTLAREGFYDLLTSYGLQKFPSGKEFKAMSESDKDVLRLKLKMATQQMQFVMSDIYVYSTKGKINKNDVINQFLQSYPDLKE